ncbi:LemA family protein [Thiosocius teredinicola]|uniref:LemA family protein n=1 Tax=Thiosocius teredinicola TaxID=1973002 RepID=UPI00099147F0
MELLLGTLALALLIWAIFIFNRLVRDRHRVLAAWSDIDVQLKRRHDLIPKLVDTVKQYAAYEQATLTAVTELRTQAAALSEPEKLASVESALGEKLHSLIAIAEDYPDLKADQHFVELQRDITEVEEHIQYARRYYNGSVRNLNTRIDSFPDLIVARLFNYRHAQLFEFDAEQA